jgi:dTDP-4-dehydrorhamnose reductase
MVRVMKVLLFGAAGQVGHELAGPLACFAEVVTANHADVDFTDPAAIGKAVRDVAPDVIVNAAAYTNVDQAEKEPEVAYQINRDAVAQLGTLARDGKMGLVHISTDFVFDGHASEAYTEEDATAPLNVYGASKLEGEQALLDLNAPAVSLRTAWIYSLRRKSFVRTMLQLAQKHERLQVVSDQVGNPTWCRDLAHGIALLLYRCRKAPHDELMAARGVYHLAARGQASRYELVQGLLELYPTPADIRTTELAPCGSDTFPLPAERPLYTALDCTLAAERFDIRLPDWRDALRRALADISS